MLLTGVYGKAIKQTAASLINPNSLHTACWVLVLFSPQRLTVSGPSPLEWSFRRVPRARVYVRLAGNLPWIHPKYTPYVWTVITSLAAHRETTHDLL